MSSDAPVPHHGPSGPWTPASPPEAAVPRSYPQLLRGPAHTWWRGALAILLSALVAAVVAVLIGLVAVFILFAQGDLDVFLDAGATPEELTARLIEQPVMFLANNLTLAALIPISMLSVWICHRWRPGWVSSVASKLRWRWMGLAFLIVLPVYALLNGITLTLDGGLTWQVDATALTLVVIILLTTPLQAAGEEYMFRGLLTQSVGSWIARPLAAVLVSAVVTGLLFAAVHSLGADQDLWLFLGRFVYGLAFSYVTWQTGGLEAAIAVHSVNNMAVMVPMALSGGLGAAVVQSESSWGGVLTSVLVIVVVCAVLVWVSRRLGLQRMHDPADQPGGPGPAGPGRGHPQTEGPFAAPRPPGVHDAGGER